MSEIRPTTPTPKPADDPGLPCRVESVTGRWSVEVGMYATLSTGEGIVFLGMQYERERQAAALTAGDARRLGQALLAVADNADRGGGAGVS